MFDRWNSIWISGLALFAVFAAAALAGCENPAWQEEVSESLPAMGHRNWIVVADAAYPYQSRDGVTTVMTGGKQLSVVRKVLQAIEKSPHVRPKVYLDAELAHVPESQARGITSYRSALNAILDGRDVEAMPHEDLIARLDEAANTFRVLVLKTKTALPYTSVFIQLDCGYWSPEAEAELRRAMSGDAAP